MTTAATSNASALEQELEGRREATSWYAPNYPSELQWATSDDIPIVDVALLDSGSESGMEEFVSQLKYAIENVGFHYIVNTGVDQDLIDSVYRITGEFCALSEEEKRRVLIDTQIPGAGYLPFQNRKLPTRKQPNMNEAFICKHEVGSRGDYTLDKTPWPDNPTEFQSVICKYAAAMRSLAMRMLPAYALALGETPNFFDESFEDPTLRLRMTQYPAVDAYAAGDLYGISPHVDTSFFTILAQQIPGLVVYSEQKGAFVRTPLLNRGELIVNGGIYLRRCSNDTVLATKHYAINADSTRARIAVPFFFNSTPDAPLPIVTSRGDPKYKATSYLSGIAVVQGE